MLSVTRFVLNQRNLGKILKGQEGTLDKDLDRRGENVADRANGQSGGVSLAKPGDAQYVSEGYVGRTRYRNTVRSSKPVVVANSPLLRSLDAARSDI